VQLCVGWPGEQHGWCSSLPSLCGCSFGWVTAHGFGNEAHLGAARQAGPAGTRSSRSTLPRRGEGPAPGLCSRAGTLHSQTARPAHPQAPQTPSPSRFPHTSARQSWTCPPRCRREHSTSRCALAPRAAQPLCGSADGGVVSAGRAGYSPCRGRK